MAGRGIKRRLRDVSWLPRRHPSLPAPRFPPVAPPPHPRPRPRRQGAALAKTLALAGVNLPMHEQAAKPREAFVALVAAVRPLPRVRVHVVAQQVGQPETLAAQLTLVRLVAIVRQHVLLQLGLVAVAFAAAGAAEGFLLMQLLVRSHVLQKGEVFSTVGTPERLLARVDDEVLLQVAAEPKGLATDFTLVRFVLGVHPHVQLQHGTEAERLPALGAFVRLGARAVVPPLPLRVAGIHLRNLFRRCSHVF